MSRYWILSLCALFFLTLSQASAQGVSPTPRPQEERATATPSATLSPTPTPTPTPIQPAWDVVDLGVAVGDAYQPISLAVDEAGGLVYVYSAASPEGPPSLSVVDSASGRLQQRILLPFAGQGGGYGKILLGPDGRAWLFNRSEQRLYTYDLATGALNQSLDGLWDVHLTSAGILAEANASLTLYSPDLGKVLFALSIRSLKLAVAGDRLLVQQRAENGEEIALYDLTSGEKLAAMDSPGSLTSLTPGPGGGWLLAVDKDVPLLWRLDSELAVVAAVEGLWSSRLFYDERRQQIVLSGYEQRRGEVYAPRYFLRSLDPSTLALRHEQTWPDWRVPDTFAATDRALYALRAYGDEDRLYHFDPETLTEEKRTILGVRLQEMAVDPAQGALFVADNQERIHRLGLADGQVNGVWPGGAPLAIDSANRRLYANRLEGNLRQVVAVDSRSGGLLARFPQSGVPSPDPNRPLVYITNAGVTVYDRAGKLRGRLESSFPVEGGFVPNPSAFRAAVNPLSGGLLVFQNNGVPGSNNRNYAVYYPPPDASGLPPDRPVTLPSPDNVLPQVVFNQQTGEGYLAYDSFRAISALQRIDAKGQVTGLLYGRAGALLFDDTAQALWVLREGSAAQFTADLHLAALYTQPGRLESSGLDPAARQVYYLDGQTPRIRHFSLDTAQPFQPAISPPQAALPAGEITRLTVLPQADGSNLLFVGLLDGSLLRSADGGRSWQLLNLASLPPANLYVAQAGESLFVTGNGSHGGDGVLTSQDGGLTWRRMVTGLVDLRSNQPIQSVDPNRAYLVTASGSLQAWDAEKASWETLALPQNFYLRGAAFQLGPEGTLYLWESGGSYRSQDGGDSWQPLPAQPAEIHTRLLAPDFASSQRVYGLSGFNRPRFVRSTDGGAGWHTPLPGFVFPPTETYHSYGMLAGQTLYLTESTNDGLVMLYRSTDGGDHWAQLGSPAALAGAKLLQVDSQGHLWFVRKEAVASVDPDRLDWVAYAPPVPATPTPTATRTPSPTPRATVTPTATPLPPCMAALSDTEKFVLGRHPRLQCPLGGPARLFVARQPFQNGEMIWRGDERLIYVLHGDGVWRVFPDTWDDSQPVWEPQQPPPPGLHLPIRGFGRVWHEELGDISAPIGWATGPESGGEEVMQAWVGGLVFHGSDGRRTVLYTDGHWQAE
ncbi:MAG: hypothetical protein KJZ86_25480 [Caldilineaceae bacterium]|nr:hypothetical protein [Caldilineaceae bacterium]